MEGGRVEICTVRPDQRAGLGIQDHSIEGPQILKRAKHWAVQDRPKVDLLVRPVVERHREAMRPYDVEAGDAVDRVRHYLSGSILTGGWPDCKRSQSFQSSAR